MEDWVTVGRHSVYLHERHTFRRCVGDQLRYGGGYELGEAELHLSRQPASIHPSIQPITIAE